MSVKQSLQELEKILQSTNPQLLSWMQVGLSKDEVNDETIGIGIDLTEDVYDLYGWKNGMTAPSGHTLGEFWIFPIGLFPPLSKSVTKYKYSVENDDYFKPSMFMLFESGGGEMYLLDCDKNSETNGMILKHYVGATTY